MHTCTRTHARAHVHTHRQILDTEEFDICYREIDLFFSSIKSVIPSWSTITRMDDHEVFEQMSVRVKRSSHGDALGNRLPQALIKTVYN